MKRTDIEWTDLSSNPLKYRDASGRVVWGCVKKSAGCLHCYAETIAHHYDRGGPFTRETMAKLTPFLDEKDLRQILTAKTIDKVPVAGSKCFLGDMTDVFGEWVSDELLDRLFAVMGLRKDVTFQLLTKRPDRMARYYGDGHRNGRGTHTSIFIAREMGRLAEQYGISSTQLDEVNGMGDSLPANIWMGTSVENQAAADERIPHLLATPAAIRFLSCEPLLGGLDLSRFHIGWSRCLRCEQARDPDSEYPLGSEIYCRADGGGCDKPLPVAGHHLHWVIVGGESGPRSRPMLVENARALVRQCQTARVPVFVKQMGSAPCVDYYSDDEAIREAALEGDGRVLVPAGRGGGYAEWKERDGQPPPGTLLQLKLKDRKGGTMEEWPEDLRLREWPQAQPPVSG